MPNWCFTTYKITGPVRDINKLYKTLNSLSSRKTPLVSNGFGNLWLGCLVNALGGDWQQIYCRGNIYNYELSADNILTIYQETAWAECPEVRRFLQQTFPDIRIYYYAYEPCLEVNETNDSSGRFFPDKYTLETDLPSFGCISDSYTTIQSLADDINEHLNTSLPPDFDTITKYLADLNTQEHYISVSKITVLPYDQYQ